MYTCICMCVCSTTLTTIITDDSTVSFFFSLSSSLSSSTATYTYSNYLDGRDSQMFTSRRLWLKMELDGEANRLSSDWADWFRWAGIMSPTPNTFFLSPPLKRCGRKKWNKIVETNGVWIQLLLSLRPHIAPFTNIWFYYQRIFYFSCCSFF